MTTSMFGLYDPATSVSPWKKVLLYGDSGSGKTRGASTWPKPIFMDFEGGMSSIPQKVARFPLDPGLRITKPAQIEQFLRLAETGLGTPAFPFETIVVDSLPELQAVILNNTLTDYKIKRFYDNLPGQSDYGKMLNDYYILIRRLLALPCNIVLITVATNRVYASDRVGPYLVGVNTAKQTTRLMDMIGFTFVQEGEAGKKSYLVGYSETELYIAKDRSPLEATTVIPNEYRYLSRRFGKLTSKEKAENGSS